MKKNTVSVFGIKGRLLSILLSLATVAGMLFGVVVIGGSSQANDVFALEDYEDASEIQNNANDTNTKIKVYFDNKSYNWKQVYTYIYDETVSPKIENKAWPGILMTYNSSLGLYEYEVPSNLYNGRAMFTETSSATTNRYPAHMQSGLAINNASRIFGANHSWNLYTPPVSELLNNSTITSTNIDYGSSVTVTGSASGGYGSYQYALDYRLSTSSTWTIAKDYSTNSIMTFTPSNGGVYTLSAKVKDAQNQVKEKQFTLTVNIDDLQNFSTISGTSVELGKSVVVSGKASGGYGGYQYRLQTKLDTETDYTFAQNFSSSSSISFTPSATGKYNLRVSVRDSHYQVVHKDFSVNVTVPELINSSTCTPAAITLGNSVSVTGKASGGTGSYQYKLEAKKSSDTSYTTIRSFGTGTSMSYKPDDIGTYNLRVTVKDSAGTTKSKTLNVAVNAPALVNNSTVSSESVTLGNGVTVNGSATGGYGTYKYLLEAKKSTDTSYTTVRSYSTDATMAYTPTETGTFDLRITVKDGQNKTAEKIFSITVKAPLLVNSSTVSATEISLGKSVTVTGKASGGTGGFQYKLEAKKAEDTAYTVVRTYSTGTSMTYTPSATGTFTLRATVKDSSGTAKAKTFTLTVNPSTLTNNSTLSASEIMIGNSVTVTGKAVGGESPYQYLLEAKKSDASSYTTVRSYGTGTTMTYTPAEAGNFTLRVTVKDSEGTKKAKTFSLSVYNEITNNSTLSAYTITLGSSVSARGSATGGSGSYQYQLEVQKPGETTWTVTRAFASGSLMTYTPEGIGTYGMRITVKDTMGNKKARTLNVNVKAAVLVNNSTASAATITKGQTVTITGDASGGTGSYNYLLEVQKSGSTSWTTVRSYSTNTSMRYTPLETGSFSLRVTVKDSSGTTVPKTFSVTVNAPTLVNNSTITKTTVNMGQSVTVTGKASGGEGTYQYLLEAQKSGTSTWTTVREYNTGTSMTYTPAEAGSFTLRVTVKDGRNKTAAKSFTLGVNEALKNNSTLSAYTIVLGNSVTANGSASGGNGTYQYQLEVQKPDETTWTVTRAYASGTAITYTPAVLGTHTLRITVKDGLGSTVGKLLKVNVKPTALENNSSLSASSTTVGTAVTVKCAASGGYKDYKYMVEYKTADTDWTTVSAYSANTNISFTPAVAADHQLKITVKDAQGQTKAKTLDLSVSDIAFNNTSTISKKVIILGETVTVNGSATGGVGSYRFALEYKNSTNTTWTSAVALSTNSKMTFKPSSAEKHSLRVTVRDERNKQCYAYFDLSVSLNELKNTSTVSGTEFNLGSTITVNGSATGGYGSYRFALDYKTTTIGWTNVVALGTTSKMTFKPTVPDTTCLRVTVKDENNQTAITYINVKVLPEVLTNTSTLSASTISLGETVTVRGSASGGYGGYRFGLAYKSDSVSEWTNAVSLSTDSNMSFKPAKGENYYLRVEVKDVKNYNAYVYLKLSVSAKPLTNNSSAENNTVKFGDNIVINGSASGGFGGYKYALDYKSDSVSTWTSVRNFESGTIMTFKPKAIENYYFCVTVKDSKNQTAKVYFKVVVQSDDLKVSTSLSASSIMLGESAVITCYASGGYGSYQFALDYKNSSVTSWTSVSGFNTTNTFTVKPATEDSYAYRITVKDSKGYKAYSYCSITIRVDNLVNTSVVEKDTIEIGEAIVINCSASGGTGGYKYSLDYKTSPSESWSNAVNYTANTKMTFTPQEITKYNLRIGVKDSSNNIAYLYPQVNVTSIKLTNLSYLDSNEVVIRDTVVVHFKAKGGSGNYMYRLEYKDEGYTEWNTLWDFDGQESFSYVSHSIGCRYLRVTAIDSENNVGYAYLKVETKSEED